MNEPTKEQIQWFWKQCGFNASPKIIPDYWVHQVDEVGWWQLPPIDLNNLDKYAVPKVFEGKLWLELLGDSIMGWDARIHHLAGNDCYSIYQDKDLALALFWAIYKAFGGKE